MRFADGFIEVSCSSLVQVPFSVKRKLIVEAYNFIDFNRNSLVNYTEGTNRISLRSGPVLCLSV